MIGETSAWDYDGPGIAAVATESDRRQRWLNAAVQTIEALLGSEDGPHLGMALEHAARAAQSDNAMLTLLNEHGELIIRALVGIDTVEVGDLLDPRLSLAGGVVNSGAPILTADYPNELIGAFAVPKSSGSAIGVPLRTDGEVIGAVTVGRLWSRGRFVDADVEHLTAFVAHIGVALEVDNVREGRRSRLFAEAYARIARELQETVVRDLFKIGIGLQGAVFDLPEQQRNRILGYTDEIDLVIERIRTTVFAPLDKPEP
jgi:GAF domain-containing protein